jgi:glutamyl-tRNA synthetase
MVRTRIAPSPTGYPHIGTIYQALFNYAYAKKHDGKFLVRIEDTDRERFVEGAEAVIFNALDWFGLQEDESPRKNHGHGPYRQSERLETYHKYAQQLLDTGYAYFAYYPKADAGQKRDYTKGAVSNESNRNSVSHNQKGEPQTIKEMIASGDWIVRMKVDKTKAITFRDEIRGDITFEGDQVTEQVLIKSDGFPTYHLASVVDDHEMGITHVVRGEEWISSTPKHVLLYSYFGWDAPKFYHTPTLRNPDKSKLSKRHGHTNVIWFQEEGYLPEAILNFLGLMGWSHPEEKEQFSLDEFIQLFDLKDIRQVGPIFDLTKLTWMNQQYIQMKSDEALKELLISFYPEAKKIPDETFNKLLPLVKTRLKTLKEFENQTVVFFADPEFIKLEEKELRIAKQFLY